MDSRRRSQALRGRSVDVPQVNSTFSLEKRKKSTNMTGATRGNALRHWGAPHVPPPSPHGSTGFFLACGAATLWHSGLPLVSLVALAGCRQTAVGRGALRALWELGGVRCNWESSSRKGRSVTSIQNIHCS